MNISTIEFNQDDESNIGNGNNLKRYKLDEALELCGYGKLHRILYFANGFTLASVLIEGLFVGYILPLAKCEIVFNVTEQGLLNSASFVGNFIGSYFWGFLADVKGRKKCISVALVSGFIFSLISCFSVNAWMLIVTRLIVGLLVGGNQANPFAYLGEFHSNKDRVSTLAKAAIFMPASMAYIPLLGIGFTAMEWRFPIGGFIFAPWRVFGIIMALTGLVAFILIQMSPESPKFLLSIGQHDEALEVLRTLYHKNQNQPKKNYPCQFIELEEGESIRKAMKFSLLWKQTKPLFVPPLLSNTAKTAIMLIILYMISYGPYIWLPEIYSIFANRLDESLTICEAVNLGFDKIANATMDTATGGCVVNTNPMSQIVLLITSLVFAILYYFMGAVINYLGPIILMRGFLLAICAAGISLIWINNFYVIVPFVIIFISSASVAVILNSISVDFFPTKYRGMAMAILLMSSRFGIVAGTNFVGALLHTPFCYLFLVICSLLALGSILLTVILPKPIK